jgi:hypothetical protein
MVMCLELHKINYIVSYVDVRTLIDAKAKTQQSKVLLHVAYVTHSHHKC